MALLLALLALAAEPAPAAVLACTPASALSAPGNWKTAFEPDAESTSFLSKEELPRVQKAMDGYAELVKSALGGNPGHAATYYRSMGGTLFRDGPAKLQVNVPLFRYECEDGTLSKEHEYSEYAGIGVNSTWHMSGPEAATLIGGKRHFVFGSPIGTIRGFPAYQTDYEGIVGVTKWVVLVARRGKRRPFRFATRQELLDSMRATAEKEWTQRLSQITTPDGKARAKKQMDKTLARLDAVRARYTPEQLAETAESHPSAVSLAWDDFDFKKTKEEACGAKGTCADGWGRPFALPARPYYDLTDSRAKPQFFTVVFQWAHGAREPEAEIAALRDGFFARFDFDKLVSLLGESKEE